MSRPRSRRESSGTSEVAGYTEEGIAALLILVGVVLFFFPEPATSAVGIALISVGVVVWIVDWLR